MYRNFYSVNDMPKALRHQTLTPENPRCDQHTEKQKKEPEQGLQEKNKGFLSKLESDDIILLVVILLLLADNCEDTLLLLAIGFVYISGMLKTPDCKKKETDRV